MEWNINARTGSPNYVIPVNLILNEIFEKNPHIFVLTEFVKSVGWLDLKSMLEEKYYMYDSPYFPHQNGICIRIKKGWGIEVVKPITHNQDSFFNLPDFYEVKVRVNSIELAVIGARIKIDCNRSNAKNKEIRHSEHKNRFEQFKRLVGYIESLTNVIILGDFNNSRILGDEMELNEEIIESIYQEKDSLEHNVQKMRSFLLRSTRKRVSLYYGEGLLSSVGAIWDNNDNIAKPPVENEKVVHKYDHLITNYVPKRIQYKWDFLKFYISEYFTKNGRIAIEYPDHAILIAEIDI